MENELNDIKINIQQEPNIVLKKSIDDYIIETKINSSKNDNENREKYYKKTPNTKIQILTKEIYLNRKNIIKNCEKSINKQYKININSLPINTSLELSSISHLKNNERIICPEKIPTTRFIDKSLIENSVNTNSFSSLNTLNKYYQYNCENKSLNQDISTCKPTYKIDENVENVENVKISPVVSTGNIDTSSESICDTENTSPDLTDSTDSNIKNEHNIKHDFKDKYFKDPVSKKRHYRRFKLKKKINEIDNNINYSDYNEDLSQSDCSPRLDTSLWNDNIENYYIEFQKICIEESIRYKQLNYRHEFISNLLKFILLLSSCFTFTLSLSSPSSVFFQVSTTITSILTTIITSIISFFTFEKRSEIEYYIYKGLDKINQNISIELIKPPHIRCDPYELILTLQNQRDELLKKIHKKM
jgi:hypothetical protein